MSSKRGMDANRKRNLANAAFWPGMYEGKAAGEIKGQIFSSSGRSVRHLKGVGARAVPEHWLSQGWKGMCHVEGWHPGAVFKFTGLAPDGAKQLITPWTQKRITTNGRLYFCRCQDGTDPKSWRYSHIRMERESISSVASGQDTGQRQPRDTVSSASSTGKGVISKVVPRMAVRSTDQGFHPASKWIATRKSGRESGSVNERKYTLPAHDTQAV